jgi:hypothetical protein
MIGVVVIGLVEKRSTSGRINGTCALHELFDLLRVIIIRVLLHVL